MDETLTMSHRVQKWLIYKKYMLIKCKTTTDFTWLLKCNEKNIKKTLTANAKKNRKEFQPYILFICA